MPIGANISMSVRSRSFSCDSTPLTRTCCTLSLRNFCGLAGVGQRIEYSLHPVDSSFCGTTKQVYESPQQFSASCLPVDQMQRCGKSGIGTTSPLFRAKAPSYMSRGWRFVTWCLFLYFHSGHGHHKKFRCTPAPPGGNPPKFEFFTNC